MYEMYCQVTPIVPKITRKNVRKYLPSLIKEDITRMNNYTVRIKKRASANFPAIVPKSIMYHESYCKKKMKVIVTNETCCPVKNETRFEVPL